MIWAILAAGAVLRLVSLNQSLWLDEAINVLAVKNYSLIGIITDYAKADFHPPGWLLILWSWTKLFGYSEVAVRMPSLIFAVITIYVIYLLGKKLVSKNVGLLAALLLGINPLHIYYSQEARMYSLAALTVSVNVLLFLKLIKGEKLNLFFLIFSNILVLASDYVAYFIFLAEFIFLLLLREKEFLKKWFIALATAAVLGSWWIPVFLSQLNVGAAASANLPAWKSAAGAFDVKAVPLTFVKFIIGRIGLADKFLYATVLLPVSALFLFLIVRGARKILVTLAVIPIILGTLISFRIPVYSYFRFLFVLPLFIILVALGILSLKPKIRYIFLAAVILIEFFSTSVYLFNPLYQREDWKGLVSYFQSLKSPVILFESSGTLPPFDYYAGESLNAKGALKDFPAGDNSAVVDPGDYSEVYLVDYLVQISDPEKLVAKKLKTLGFKEADIKDFHGVGFVYHYVK